MDSIFVSLESPFARGSDRAVALRYIPSVFDAIVIGGGPAGSGTATHLARAGRRVLLLERERHPREHIGESLLPGVLPYLEALGLRERVDAAGFERKEGQTFIWGVDRTPWEIDFRELDLHPYSFFVERSRFDEILLRHAAACGAAVVEEATVSQVIFEAGRAVGVTYRTADGSDHVARASFIVDATGQSALVARGAGMRRLVRGLKNVALWSYWEGAARLPGHKRAHILTTSIPEGWIWVIPLGDRTSVGVVTSTVTRAARDSMGATAWYEEAIASVPQVRTLLEAARRVTDVTGARDWSYRSRRFTGPGIFLAGDAACFIDPILSTGVNLAMTAAYWAASAIDSALAEPRHEAFFRAFYERTYANMYGELLMQVKAFYRAEGRKDSIFWASKRVLRVDEAVTPELGFLFICAGLLRNAATPDPHDAVSQLRDGLGARVQLALAAPDGRASRLSGPAITARARSQVVSSPLVWRTGKPGASQLVTVRASGMRLRVVPHEPRGIADRPADSFFAVELVDANRDPMALVIVEERRTSHGPGTSRFSASVIPYGRALSDEARRDIEDALAGAMTALDPDGKGLGRARSRFRAWLRQHELPHGVRPDLTSRRSGGGMAQPPLTAVFRERNGGIRAYLVLEARLPPELTEIPVLRTRHLDLWLKPDRMPDGRALLDVRPARALVERCVAALDEGLRGVGTVGAAFSRAEALLRTLAVDATDFDLEACGRLGATLPEESSAAGA